MKIIIKPLGAICLVAALVALATLAFLHNRKGGEAPDATAAAVPAAAPGGGTTAAAPAAGGDATTPEGPPTRGYAIYRDGMENGWENWSWDTTADLSSTQAVHSGKYALRAECKPYGGVKFHHTALNTRPYDRICFYINGGPTGGQLLQVGGNCAEKTTGGKSATLPPLPANKWVAVTLRLDGADLANKPDMTSFWIQNTANNPSAPFYVDEVRLLLPSEPAPTGTPLPTTSVVVTPSPAAPAK